MLEDSAEVALLEGQTGSQEGTFVQNGAHQAKRDQKAA